MTQPHSGPPEDLQARLGRQQGVGTVPLHVCKRIVALIPTDEIVYSDCHLEPAGERRGLSGQIVVLTDRLVLLAELAGSTDNEFSMTDGGSTVSVSVWPRRHLRGIAMPPSAGVGGAGQDIYWHQWQKEGWPPGTRLILDYPGREPLTLPTNKWDQSSEAISALYPSLLEDLLAAPPAT